MSSQVPLPQSLEASKQTAVGGPEGVIRAPKPETLNSKP